jgi:hypothetical protein
MNSRRLTRYLVGEQVKLRRDRNSQQVGGLAVDYELEQSGLLDWQVSRLRSFDDLVDEDGGAPKKLLQAFAVAHETTYSRCAKIEGSR